MRLLALLGLICCYLFGCGGSTQSPTATPLSPDTGTIVPAPGPGASVDGRREGAASTTVEVLDRSGNLLQSSLTDSTGYFRFDNLPTGLLQVRLQGQVIPFSSFPAAFIHLGREFPVSREEAARRAVAEFTEVTVTGTMTPLPAGTVVGVSDGNEVRTTGEEWFFLVDLMPGVRYRHHVEFVFVDARTGEETRLDQQSYPTLNGSGYWGSDRDYFDYPGFDPGNLDATVQAVPTPEVVAAISSQPPARVIAPRRAKHNGEPDSVFAVLIQGGHESGSEADIIHMFQFLKRNGVPANFAAPDEGNVQVVNLVGDTEEQAKSSLENAVAVVNGQIKKRHERGLHSTSIVYFSGHGGGGDVSFSNSEGGQSSIRAGKTSDPSAIRLDQVGVTQTLACRVRFIIDACDTDQFCRELKFAFDPLEHDFAAMGAASAGQPAGSANAYFQAVSGGYFTDAIIRNGFISGGDLSGITRDNFTVSSDRYLEPLRFLGNFTDPKSKLVEPQNPCLFVRPKEPAFCHQPKLAAVSLDFANSVSTYKLDHEETQRRETRQRIAPDSLVPGSPFPAGQGPNHVTVTPDGRFAYSADNRGSTISGFSVSPEGTLQPVPGSPFPAQIFPSFNLVDPSGHYLYVSNFGSNNISVFGIEPDQGGLAQIAGSPFPVGRNPGHIAIHPAGRLLYVANGSDNNISILALDPSTGRLTSSGVGPAATETFPRNVTIDPSGRYLYATNVGSNSVSGFRIDEVTGALAPVAGSPYPTGANPQRIAIPSPGKFLYVSNFDSGNVSGYGLDPETGSLSALPGFPVTAGAGAAGIAADDSNLYVTCIFANSVLSFAVDSATGALQLTDTTPADGGPSSIFVFEAPVENVMRKILSRLVRDEWCGSPRS